MELCVVQSLIPYYFLWHRGKIHVKFTVVEVVFTDKVGVKQTLHSNGSRLGYVVLLMKCKQCEGLQQTFSGLITAACWHKPGFQLSWGEGWLRLLKLQHRM